MQQNLVENVRILHNSDTELYVEGDPQTGLTALRVELQLRDSVICKPCKWFVPFHWLYNSVAKDRDTQENKLQSPAFFTDGSMTADDYEKLRMDLIALGDNGKSLERATSVYWGYDKLPSEIVPAALLRILDNLKDPLHAFENVLKAAVEMACRRVPKSIWNTVSKATITVDKDYVNVKLKK